jgi:hypothetical protein
MLIFNCTEAASTFFSRVHKGKNQPSGETAIALYRGR